MRVAKYFGAIELGETAIDGKVILKFVVIGVS
jgi:hypothetical protein